MTAHGAPAKLVSNAGGFPHPVPLSVILIVARALRKAWEIICADPEKHLAPASSSNPEEDRYTDALCEILLWWLSHPEEGVEGFSREIFETVCRGENLSNYDMKVINKQPDLVIRLAKSPMDQLKRYVGLFAETKIVSKGKTIGAYTGDGVARFVRGDYGWGMQDGLMLAYQKKPHRDIGSLAKKLEEDGALCVEAEDGSALVTVGLPVGLCGKSTHRRDWTYQNGDAPGTIRLWHLWALRCPES